jgi:hypothetical protein
MRVLSYSDLPVSSPGHHLFLVHQVTKEVMATLASAQAVATVGSSIAASLTPGL